MKESIKCAVLGLGRLGYWHAENLVSKVQGAELVKVIDPMEGRAEQVEKELGVNKTSKESNKAMLKEKIDEIDIVTPKSTHTEMIKKAASHSKHLFIKKPIKKTLEQADEV